MPRSESEKYATRHYQDQQGRWHTERELVHDPRYCDICDSEDVEQSSEPVTVDGQYGGVRILWTSVGNAHGPKVVEALCRTHRAQCFEAQMNAERRLVEVDGWTEAAYACPAHGTDHYEIVGEHEARVAEMREWIR